MASPANDGMAIFFVCLFCLEAGAGLLSFHQVIEDQQPRYIVPMSDEQAGLVGSSGLGPGLA